MDYVKLLGGIRHTRGSCFVAKHSWSLERRPSRNRKYGRDHELGADENGDPKESVLPVEMKAQAVAELEARSGSAAEVVIDSFIFQGCVEFYRSEYIEVA